MARSLRTFHHVLQNNLKGFACAPAQFLAAHSANVLGEMVVFKNDAIAKERVRLEGGIFDEEPPEGIYLAKMMGKP